MFTNKTIRRQKLFGLFHRAVVFLLNIFTERCPLLMLTVRRYFCCSPSLLSLGARTTKTVIHKIIKYVDTKTTIFYSKQINVVALHLIFHRFSPFNSCLSVVLWLDKRDYPENSHVVFCPNSVLLNFYVL